MTTQRAATPTGEPYDVELSREERASIAVRLAARTAASAGVPMELALAEARYAYEHGWCTR